MTYNYVKTLCLTEKITKKLVRMTKKTTRIKNNDTISKKTTKYIEYLFFD